MADYDNANGNGSPRAGDDDHHANGDNGTEITREQQSPRGERDGEDTMMDRERSPAAYRQDRDDEDDGRDRRGGRDDRDDRGGDRERSPRRRPPPPPPGRDREAQVSNVLGCFGLSIRTRDIDLEDEFNRYGHVEKAVIVYDQRSERSRGFGFVTMRTEEEAARCIDKLNGIELHGRNIRVAYSLTQKPHQATPGEYMGFKSDRDRPPPRRYDDRDRRGGYDDRRGGGYDDRRGGGGYRDDRRGGYDDRDRYRRDRDYDDRRGGGGRGGRDYDRYADTAAAPMAASSAYDDRDRYSSSRRDDSPRRSDYRSSRY